MTTAPTLAEEVESLIGPQETWRVVMGHPDDYSRELRVDVPAFSDVGAYWASVSLNPGWYVDRIFPEREAI